jgi:hypothetical protein
MPDSINEALIEAVKALGGSKAVGALLWPEKTIDAAQRALLDALNEERPARLAPEQVLFIMRKARERGYHGLMHFLCSDLSYAEPVPIDPKDELTDLLRQYLARREDDAHKDSRLERLLQQHLGLKVAA